MTYFSISVIIPVYNAAAHVRRAVESALAQPETAEVILVEDGSTDESLSVCAQLAAQNSIVHLYRHPGGGNWGAAASRNLGILKSTCEFVGFLDADDAYLPYRFSVAKLLFESDPKLDGVYEAVAIRVESQSGFERWKAAGRGVSELVTIREVVPPECLFEVLVRGGVGFFHVDGLVVRRSVFDKTGLYDEHLRVQEDEAMNLKMAAVARLTPGRLDEPVALYNVHDYNTISAPRPKSEIYRRRMIMYATVWRWSRQNLDKAKQQALLDLFVRRGRGMSRFDFGESSSRLARFLQGRLQLFLLFFEYPSLLLTSVFWKYLAPNPGSWKSRLLMAAKQRVSLD